MNDSAGALALVGSGEYLAQSHELERALVASAQQLRGESAKYYVQIPTASGHESPDRRAYWRNLGESAASRIGIEQKYLDVQKNSNDKPWKGFQPRYSTGMELLHAMPK
jgi:cyanophycinase